MKKKWLYRGGRRKILGVKGGVTKNSFKFCNDGICNNVQTAYHNAKNQCLNGP